MKGAFINWLFFGLIVFPLFFQGCDLRKKEEALKQKEISLNQKEQELLLKEKTLDLREKDIIAREQKIDSSIVDTSGIVNPALVGVWDVKLNCIETTCTGYAVGDTKTEQWELSYQGNTIIAKATTNGNLIRVYSGIFTGNTVELIENREKDPAQPPTKMIVRLRITGEKTMGGQREIVRDDCKVLFTVEMTKTVVNL